MADPNIVIVGEITEVLRAQGNPTATGLSIDASADSPIVSGNYRLVPQIQIGIMPYNDFANNATFNTPVANTGRSMWNAIGAVGLDAIFSPYSTQTESARAGAWLPHFTAPSGASASGTDPTSITLNPFNIFNSLSGIKSTGHPITNDPWQNSGHNISFALNYNPYDSGINGSGGFVGATGLYPGGSGSPIDINFEKDHFARHTVETQGIRGVGLRSPIILSGPGYDITGNPVPGISGRMHPEAAWNTSLWKSGPVDLRWSESRGVWVPPKVCDEIFFRIASFDPASMTALGELIGCDEGYELTEVQGQTSPGILIVEVFDFLGCIFDEPSSDLFNRVGIARWKRVKVNEVLQPAQWIVETLCCKSPACEV